MRIRTDYMRVKTIRSFISSLDEVMEILRGEAAAGNLYSGLQADVIEPISAKLKDIVGCADGR